MASLACRRALPWRRLFSTSTTRRDVRDVKVLPNRIYPDYQAIHNNDLLCLRWPSPPRNVLITKKEGATETTSALVEYVNHICSTYPGTNVILQQHDAAELHSQLSCPVYATNPSSSFSSSSDSRLLAEKVDVISTLGGDGTILHAASLFATTASVPPILSFGMGTLGFLGEYKFSEHKRAFREMYVSGARDGYSDPSDAASHTSHHGGSSADAGDGTRRAGWSSVRGMSMGSSRAARVLLRNRLRVGLFDSSGARLGGDSRRSSSPAAAAASSEGDVYAVNEVIVHRGGDPHMAVVEVFVGGRFLTEAVADGMIISSPTGSTAYSLSSGGSIVHPLVDSLLLTPVCPRSLSFRPLVLPPSTPITLRLSEKNRGRELEVSIDGVRISRGMGVGAEVRVLGEEIANGDGCWRGGVPSIVRGAAGMEDQSQDHWVGGLNALLKFNYPFGEEDS